MGNIKRHIKRTHAKAAKTRARIKQASKDMAGGPVTVVGTGSQGSLAQKAKELAPHITKVTKRRGSETRRTQAYAKSKVRHR